jgi:TPP-dependent indolepyruvate ferredoxin oxidoreductase alpha subunit
MPTDFRAEATKTLTHYFRTAFQKVGLKWERDNDVEIATAVDQIINAAVQHLQAESQKAMQEVLKQPQLCQGCGHQVTYDPDLKTSELLIQHKEGCLMRDEIKRQRGEA